MNVYDVRLTDDYPACGMSWPPELSDVYMYLRVRLPSSLASLPFFPLSQLTDNLSFFLPLFATASRRCLSPSRNRTQDRMGRMQRSRRRSPRKLQVSSVNRSFPVLAREDPHLALCGSGGSDM